MCVADNVMDTSEEVRQDLHGLLCNAIEQLQLLKGRRGKARAKAIRSCRRRCQRRVRCRLFQSVQRGSYVCLQPYNECVQGVQ